MNSLRVLIADNSATYRKMFTRALSELDNNALVTCVTNRDEAIDCIQRFDYEIIVIDADVFGLHMLLKEIVMQIPKAFILITSRPSNSSDELCKEALAYGAADCLTKPIQSSYNDNYDVVKQKMESIIKIVVQDRINALAQRTSTGSNRLRMANIQSFRAGLVLIAASTGGPPALERILQSLKSDFPVPILIVQHMLPQFTETLAQNLNQKSPLEVKVAVNRENIKPGTVYIAPGGMHMKLDAKGLVRLDDSPPISGLKPAADILFMSIAETYSGPGVLTVILTGMGHDGRNGLSLLKDKQHCFCIAQSEETCIVYGMPRAAIDNGYADLVVDLDNIASELESRTYGK